MNGKQDIRWVQRLNHYCKALDELTVEIELNTERRLSDLEKKGVIRSFEIVQELSWLSIKDFYQSVGEKNIHGSLDAFRLAYKRGLVKNPSLVETVESRNKTAHTYNAEIAAEIFHDIVEKYYDAFEELRESLLGEKRRRNV